MRKLAIVFAGILTGGLAQAENLEGVDKMICAAAQVQICIENDTCYAATPAELDIPNFVVIDTKKKTISTTRASNQNRSTPFTNVEKSDGLFYLQGIEGGRAFSFVIDEATGHMTVAVSRDGLSISVFGACTDADI
jgi:hypothetical protein